MQRYLIILLLILGVSCTQEAPSEPEIEQSVLNLTLSDGVKQEWKSGDKVSVISMKNGTIVTVDTFTAQEDGTTASFKGGYTGAADASLTVVYPAVENTGDQNYESARLHGNQSGYFRAVKGTSYVLFAPDPGMKILQQKNADASGLEPLRFLMAGSSASVFNTSGTVSLEGKTSLIKLELDASAMKSNDKVQKVALTLDNGTPFTNYRGSMSLGGTFDKWITNEPSASFEMALGHFAHGGKLVLYVPVFPNNTGASLAAKAERMMTVYVKAETGVYYEAFLTIPANSKDYDLSAGSEVTIQLKLKESNYRDPEPPALGEPRKIMDKGVSALCKDGDILYVGSGGALYSWDIKDPKNPKQIGSVLFPGSVRQIAVCNGTLVVSARETGVWLFNVSNPSNMSLITRYDGIELSTGIDMAGDCIFVGERQTGVEFVDARNLTKPQHIRVIKTPESQTVFYQDGYLYSGEWAAGQVSIFNAKDMSNIQLVKTINLQGYGDGLWVTGNRLYASTGHHHKNETPSTQEGDGHGVEIWDVTTPENPRFISRVEFDVFYRSGADWWLVRPSGDGKTLYCGDVFNGMYIVDITDEKNPEIIYHWEPLGNSPSTKVNAVSSIALAEGVVYLTVSGEGLYMMESPRAKPSKRNRCTAPINLNARYNYPTSSDSHFNAWVPDKRGAVKGAAVYGDALFVGAGDAGLYTVKLDGSGKPYTVARKDIPFAGGVAINGDKLYVARGYEGLGVYKIKSDLSLTEIALLKTELNPTKPADQFSYWVSAPNDNYVVNGCRRSGYQFLAVGGTTDKPTYTFKRQYVQNLSYNRYISEKTNNDGIMAYATRSGLIWIDLSSTTAVPAPVMYDQLKNSLAEGATLYKNNEFLLTRDYRLCTIKSEASYIDKNSQWHEHFSGIPRWESGDIVLLCNFVNRYVSKVNTRDITNAELLFNEKTIGYPEPGLFWKGKCVVPCGYQGLLIEK